VSGTGLHGAITRATGGSSRETTEPNDHGARTRAFRRAAVAWSAGKPHQAWEILAESGYGHLWPVFMTGALVRARREFTVRMPR
jgi:hypothetical protein